MLRCCGDEDLATRGARRTALARAIRVRADVVVDFSDLSFADASLMLDLAMLALRLRHNGRQLVLRGARPHIHRLIEIVGLNRQPGVAYA
ncbi:MAG TPA: STAS domain-containing protein [Solirubrobacteraceae bacterium]|nr:STAS domain-containing protein [Solirubrobacteraceae bacterium]